MSRSASGNQDSRALVLWRSLPRYFFRRPYPGARCAASDAASTTARCPGGDSTTSSSASRSVSSSDTRNVVRKAPHSWNEMYESNWMKAHRWTANSIESQRTIQRLQTQEKWKCIPWKASNWKLSKNYERKCDGAISRSTRNKRISSSYSAELPSRQTM